MDSYQTVSHTSEAQYTEKRSRFLSFVYPVKDEDEVKARLESLRKEYYDARHICYAYILGYEGETFRAGDDGEPSGTAGRPILGQIKARNLTFTLVAVVRYFGGIKLGTGPLGLAYKESAVLALEMAGTEEKIVTTSFRVSVPYTEADVAMRKIAQAGGEITARDYDEHGTILTVSIRKDDASVIRDSLAKIHTLTWLKEED